MTDTTLGPSDDIEFVAEANEQVQQVYDAYRAGKLQLSGDLVTALTQMREQLVAIRVDGSSNPATADQRNAACGLIAEILREAASPVCPAPPLAQPEYGSPPALQPPAGPYGSPASPGPDPMWPPPPPWASPPLPPPTRRTGRTIAIVAGSVVVLLVVLGVIGAVAGTKKHDTNTHLPAGAAAVPVNSPTTPAGFTAFHSKADQFTIDLPNSWKAVDPSSPGAQAAINELAQSNPNLRSTFGQSALQLAEQGMALVALNPVVGSDGFAANVNVVAKPDLTFSSGDLSQIAAALPTELAKLGGTVTGTSYLTLGGHEALRSTDTLPITTLAGTHLKVSQSQYFVGANGFVYAITISGTDPNLAAIANSFSTK
jgi:hypothetical protein